MATTIENSIVIHLPIEEVFETATCMESCINWWTMVKDAKKVSSGPTGVGSEYVHKAKFMGITVESHPTITVWEPPKHFAFTSDTPTAKMDVEFNFEPVESGTKMTIKMTAHPNESVVSKTMLPLVVSAAARQFSNDMQGLKDMLENGVKVKIW